ncbi:MAG: hypothetical protein NC517_00365 [Firmicutes bacterium]|nr:hypothetical protein [Bacillota bacterium]
MNRWKQNYRQPAAYLFCFLAAAIPLLICSKSSPLYPFNDWPDVNIFFTMGKGMLNGRIPYVDLLDHKGPYAYALGGAAYLLSSEDFHGYFLFELISMFFFILYTYKTIRLYTERPALWVLPFLSVGVTTAKSFVHGGSMEELSLGIFAYAIYSLLLFMRDKEGKAMPVTTLTANGIWAGILLESKFTLLGLYIVWIMAVALKILYKKKWKELFRSVGIFLAAMLAATVPWLIYFGINNAIADWFKTYFWDNIFGYAQWGDVSLIQKVWKAVLNTLRSLKDIGNRTYSLFVAGGALVYACFPAGKIAWREKISVAFMGLVMGVGIFIGETKHDYYGLPLAVFSMFGGIGLVMLFGASEQWLKKLLKKWSAPLYIIAVSLILMICAGAAYAISPNTYLLAVEQEQMPQFRFAEQICESSDRTILNYGFLDGGFYTVLGEVPNMKVFCVINRNPDQMLAEQNGYIREGRTHFVVTWKAYEASEEELLELPVVSEYYELIDYLYFEFEGDVRTYALYERRS